MSHDPNSTEHKSVSEQSISEAPFFAKTSVFRSIPASLRTDQRVLLDGIRYSIEMLDVSYLRLTKTLLSIADIRAARSSEFPHRVFPDALTDAWSVIDTIVRLTNLVKRLPKWKRSPMVRSFLTTTATAEQLRHAYQHLEGKINKLAAENRPVWGTLHWATPIEGTQSYRLHTLVPGTLHSAEHPFKDNRASMLSVVLRAHGHVLDIFAAMQSVERLARSLEASLAAQFKGQPGSASDVYISVDFTPDAPGPPAAIGPGPPAASS